MNRRARSIYFVCIAVTTHGDLITKIIQALSLGEATELFVAEFAMQPQEVLGPFLKKRTQILENTRTLKFTDQIKKAIYHDWLVNAFILKEPEDQAYLVFIKRVDNKKIPFPKGTITIPINDLRFIENAN